MISAILKAGLTLYNIMYCVLAPRKMSSYVALYLIDGKILISIMNSYKIYCLKFWYNNIINNAKLYKTP